MGPEIVDELRARRPGVAHALSDRIQRCSIHDGHLLRSLQVPDRAPGQPSWGSALLTPGYDCPVARPVWSGTITFGLVNVPVKAFSAVRDHDVHFHQLQKRTGSRIRYRKVAEKSGREV